jgi:hypothetical protein
MPNVPPRPISRSKGKGNAASLPCTPGPSKLAGQAAPLQDEDMVGNRDPKEGPSQQADESMESDTSYIQISATYDNLLCTCALSSKECFY